MGTTQSNNLAQTPNNTPISDKDTGKVNFIWNQWFTNVQIKLNTITASIVALSKNVTAGFFASDGAGGVYARTLTAGTGISITNGTGVGGNPVISASGGAGGSPMHVTTNTATSYTAQLTDAPASTANVGWIDSQNSSANTINIDTNANVPFPVGTDLSICQGGSGTTTIEYMPGVIFTSPTITAGGQYSVGRAVQVAINTWRIFGNLATAAYPIFNILDYLTATPAAAYSLRLLRNTYAGKCINVRRSSDNTTLDIGFVGGVLDTASLLTFVGSGNGFIVTWYDQSGNGLNATQATAASQPQIVNAGVVIVQGSRPSLTFYVASTISYLAATINSFSAGYALNAVCNLTTTSLGCIADKSTSGGVAAPWAMFNGSSSFNRLYVGNGSTQNYWVPSPASTAGFNVYTHQLLASTKYGEFFDNGTANGTATVSTTYGDTTNPVTIGKRGDAATYFNGNMSEIIFFGTPLSTTDRNTLERNQGNIYGISVS